MPETDPFYQSQRWRHLREAVLRRDGYQCQYYRRFGKRVPATVVHHILPREQYPEYQWQPWNLISLSMDAHNKMHDRDSGALTDEGKKMLRRVEQKLGEISPPLSQSSSGVK